MNTSSLAKVFNLPEQQNPQLDDAPVVPRSDATELSKTDEITDIDYARRTLQFTIERSQQLIDMALQNVSDRASPRDIEAASGALMTCANLTEKLLGIYNNIQKTAPNPGTGNTFVNNNNKTVVLSTSELLNELMKETE